MDDVHDNYKPGYPYLFTNYYIYDENVECYVGTECFLTQKREYSLNRDDICEHCNREWKWHYNKD